MSQAPGNEIPHTLAALDWGGITCQSGAGCTNRASYVVHLHAVDECNDPDLDPFGNTVEILCIACLWHVEAKVLLQVGRLPFPGRVLPDLWGAGARTHRHHARRRCVVG